MSDLAFADIAARVVAWHNRHPLARRLRVTDVHSVGHVALPFHDPAKASAELPPEAASGATPARGAGGPLRSAFREDFIPPWTPDEVATFAARHGVERDTEPRDAPVRRVMPLPDSRDLVLRWLWTAELRSATARTRVLLGPVPGAPVLGRRLWSLPRLGALAALGGAVLAGALAAGVFDGGRPAAGAAQPAQGAGSSAAGTAMAVPPPASADAGSGAATAAPEADPAASAAARPPDVEPRLGRIELPPIGSIADARRRPPAAQAASAAAPTPDASAGTPVAAVAPAAPAASAPAYALATRRLRTRTESEQIARALGAVLVVPGSPVQKIEVLRVGDDFRVVAWPYPTRADAERAQASLRARGHALQLIEF